MVNGEHVDGRRTQPLMYVEATLSRSVAHVVLSHVTELLSPSQSDFRIKHLSSRNAEFGILIASDGLTWC